MSDHRSPGGVPHQCPREWRIDAHAALRQYDQARRVAARLERFKRAEIDFDGVPDIGHAFADELFRVFPAQGGGGVELVPVNANRRILALIENAKAG